MKRSWLMGRVRMLGEGLGGVGIILLLLDESRGGEGKYARQTNERNNSPRCFTNATDALPLAACSQERSRIGRLQHERARTVQYGDKPYIALTRSINLTGIVAGTKLAHNSPLSTEPKFERQARERSMPPGHLDL